MDVQVLDCDLEAAVPQFTGQQFRKAACTVPTSCAAVGDAAGAGGEVGVVGEVGEQFAGAGGVQDDVLDAGVESVQVEDVAGGGRVAQPVADVLDPVGGRRDGAAVRAGGPAETVWEAIAMVLERLPVGCGSAFLGTPEELTVHEAMQGQLNS